MDGPKWQEQRRFALHALRDLGFGKDTIEDIVREELAGLVNELEFAGPSAHVNVTLPLMRCFGNVIGKLLFDARISTDPEFDHVIDALAHFLPPFTSKRPWVAMIAE